MAVIHQERRRKSSRLMERGKPPKFRNTINTPVVIDVEDGSTTSKSTDSDSKLLKEEGITADVETRFKDLNMKDISSQRLQENEEEKHTDVEVINLGSSIGQKHRQTIDIEDSPMQLHETFSGMKRMSYEERKHPITSSKRAKREIDDDFMKSTPCFGGASRRFSRSISRSLSKGRKMKSDGRQHVKISIKKGQAKANAEKRSKIKKASNQGESSHTRSTKIEILRTRTSPRSLHDTIIALNDDQKKAVKSMGLESLLEMSIDGIPSKLGFFVVDSLDTKSMCLKTKNGDIPISVNSVHEILGLPIGGIDILEEDETREGMSIWRTWKNQFDKPKMRPKDVMKLILQSKESDFTFKLNFLVLFVNLLCECSSMGCCNLGFLRKIKNESMLPRIDWCKFIYQKIKSSKMRWKSDNELCFYYGPLTYITLLYVESTFSEHVPDPGVRPSISGWNKGLLRKREATELECGGFGLLPLHTHQKQKLVSSAKKGKSTNEPKSQPKEGITRQDYIGRICNKMATLKEIKCNVEKDLDEAWLKYPNDEDLVHTIRYLESMFNYEQKSTDAEPSYATMQEDEGNEATVQEYYSPLRVDGIEGNFEEDPSAIMWESPNFIADVVAEVIKQRRGQTQRKN